MRKIPTLLRRAETKITIGTTIAYGFLLWTAPSVATATAALLLLLTLVLVGARLACALLQAPHPERLEPTGDEFVSIHIATYSEPAEVVMRTLDSLTNLEHQNYEVIVLDNNTPDPELYEPVREYCQKLGPKFRFYHYDNVKGAKAGALNISLELSDPRTDVILILDADYQAKPGLLKTGLSYFVDSTVGLVQFPQAYRNSEDNCGLSWEYKIFFDVYMKLANRWNTVLSTGTAAFVRREPLEACGGWSGESLTEDAELGVRLHRCGYRGVYVPEVVAAGLMPTDLKSLRAQRRRWVLGNAQSLAGLLREKKVDGFRKAVMGLQLTAWANPLILSAVTFLISAAFYVSTASSDALLPLFLSMLSIVTYLNGTLLFFVIAILREGGSLLAALNAYCVHLGMLWEGSVSWCELFVESDKSFVRTDKFIRAPEKVALVLAAVFSLVFGGLGLNMLWWGGSFPLAFGFAMLSMTTLGTAALRWNLYQIRERTVALSDLEAKRWKSKKSGSRGALDRSLSEAS